MNPKTVLYSSTWDTPKPSCTTKLIMYATHRVWKKSCCTPVYILILIFQPRHYCLTRCQTTLKILCLLNEKFVLHDLKCNIYFRRCVGTRNNQTQSCHDITREIAKRWSKKIRERFFKISVIYICVFELCNQPKPPKPIYTNLGWQNGDLRDSITAL